MSKYLGSKMKSGGNRLTNNFRANISFLALGWIILVASYFIGFLPDSDSSKSVVSFLYLATIFSGGYILTSFWFSPDIDIRSNRPGKHSFPFSPIIKLLRKLQKIVPIAKFLLGPVILVLDLLHYPLNRVWAFLTSPISLLFTHRGAVHWPFIGTAIKISYFSVLFFLIGKFIYIPISFIPANLNLETVFDWVKNVGPLWLFNLLLDGEIGRTVLFSIIFADICHTAVDFYDYIKNGNRNFVPPEVIAPRGLLIRLVKFFLKPTKR